MHKREWNGKYYSIRANVLWVCVLVMGILFAAMLGIIYKEKFCAGSELDHEQSERIEITYDHLESDLDDITQCYLCGNSNESLISYYRKFGTIGLISLNDWYVLNFHLKAYDENGIEIKESSPNNSTWGRTKEISYSSDGITSRGMAWIDVTLPEKYKLDMTFLEKHLCSQCLGKIAGSLEYWKNETEDKEAIPLALVDFDTLEIYSLQEYYHSYFIRDYYVEIDFKQNKVSVEVFYLPEHEQQE